ncbi:sugar phosphate nucleotidyltransferase [Halopiger xanaduensis]|uniref:Nucleotidyl transferase n=1 Tax=Halopiger xanaduensis (strain DSM 18323 / JCM 14033 / SH-6) TaxID=797210 RepID=F8DD64_HALXS|nr:NDP-sugar synthase [Halopiger xanaduensis]AEH38951.1 Nucleotidyl transferase [Halopiger xanaduensis SH-6]
MDAIVLAGGYATRLWPITKDRPKMFLPLDGSTVIDPIFRSLESDDRIDTVYVSTNERFAATFERYLASSPFDKPTLSIENTTGEDEKFGVISALAQLVDREGITDDTIIVAGDNYISFDVSEFIDFFRAKGQPTVAAYDVGSRTKARSYGVVELENDRICDFEEKPESPASSLVSIACYGFPSESIDLLDTYLEDGNNPDEPGWFVQWLQNRTPTYAFSFDGAWFDIGTPESYLDAVAFELDGSSTIAESATVRNSEIGDGVQILDGATVVDAELERAVVFPDATVRDATMRDAIVGRDSTVRTVDLCSTMIGRRRELTPASL